MLSKRCLELTQALLKQLDVTPLGTALLAHLVIVTVVRESLAGSTRWSRPVTLQLPLPTQYTSYPLRFSRCVSLRVLVVRFVLL